MPSEPIELIFPLKGINDAWGFGKQPEGTCPDASNCIPFDTLDSRARGGQRWGISKYYADLHNGANAIQRMTSLASVVSVPSPVTDDFTQANGVLDDTDWYPLEYSALQFVVSATNPRVAGNEVVFDDSDGAGYCAAIHKSAEITSSFYEISADVTLVTDQDDAIAVVGFLTRSTTTFPAYIDEMIWAYVKITRNSDDDDDYGLTLLISGHAVTLIPMTPGSDDYLDPAWWADPRSLKLVVSGNTFSLYVEDTLLVSHVVTGLRANTAVGFIMDATDLFTCEVTLDNFSFEGFVSESGRDYILIAVSEGDIYVGSPYGALALATDGENVVNTSGRVDAQPAFGKVYFADSDPSNYEYLDSENDTVYSWTAAITAGLLPCDATSTNTTYAIATADAATKKFTHTGDLTAVIFVNDYIKVSSSTANNGIYSVSAIAEAGGTTTITVRQTVVDSGASGNIQLCDLGCKIIKLYRGRIIMAGLRGDPQNWFMSAAGDPLDWDYGATVSATMAVAGNNTDAGYCPDIITCLAPYSDDLLYIGGDHSIWMMRGDPANKGRIDNISYQTGISGPDAYAFDPNGIFYFFGSGTVWRMTANGVPEPLSRNRMDQAFKDINTATHTVHFAWDNARHGLFIFIRPSAKGSTTHYFWDERTDGFWKVIFPNAQGPTTVYAFDGDNPDDNALLLGGWDGYIRYPDSSADDDDDTAIDSYVLYPPITAGGPLNNIRINSITAVLDTESDDVLMTIYAEDTVQKVVESATSTDAAVDITAVNEENKTFTVAEDWSGRKAGDRLLVAGSTDNDGSYTLASLTGAGPTVLTVNETIPDEETPDGTIQYKDRAKFTRSLPAERTKVLSRIAGNAIMIKLSNSTDDETWAIETLLANVEVVGRTRKNQL